VPFDDEDMVEGRKLIMVMGIYNTWNGEGKIGRCILITKDGLETPSSDEKSINLLLACFG